MKDRLKSLFILGKRTSDVFNNNSMVVYSGNSTFYILLSLIPLSLLIVAAVGSLLPEEYLISFVEVISEIFPSIPQVQTMLSGVFANIRDNANAVLVGVSAFSLLWSAASGVNAIQLGLNRIGCVTQTFFRRRAASLLYTFLFIILIPVMIVFRVMRSSIEELVIRLGEVFQLSDVAARIVQVLESSGVLTLFATLIIILLVYSYLPSWRRSWKHQLPGAFFTTVLWGLFSKLFDFFIMNFWKASFLYGSLAAIFLLAMWMNIIMEILFLGASLNQALYEQRVLGGPGNGNPEAVNDSRREICILLAILMIGLACILKGIL